MNILGVGRALPEQVITNEQLTQILDTNDEWIVSRTGIKQRHVMADQGLTSLAADAAKEALQDAGLTAQDIDLILVATTMGDYVFPSVACLVQGKIGAACPALDLHAACTGFIYALDAADSALKAGKARHVLVIGAEAITRLSDWTDRATCVLFGDGAGAVVVGAGDSLLSMHLNAQCNDRVLYHLADPGNSPYTDKGQEAYSGLKMAGQDVFRFAVGQSPRDLEAAADKAGLSIDDMDWVLLHQANRRILDSVRSRLKLDPMKLPSNIHRTGNTSAASIPLLLWELYHSGMLLPGHLMAMSAFGAGLTSGACVIRWTKAPPKDLVPAEDLLPQEEKANG